ncbi:hypothetical protein PNEG_01710 [Pneumocystis murina B123]|uniref:ENTH domain-containing protein n=1 Tax=Pneumocystis murina (strain B123) TaxID=1069680 RepID=M7NRP5_PNEMU|nr:hypothetical protein PNEG_01710 [Pneumocystis murina B123]EMR09952.1 hypothetical protein PNEG_01710 [Pneumocystis murina B123]
MYTGKAAIRTVKNLKYSDVQNKVRSATSNDPWGPSGVEMNEIARMTFDPHNFIEVMDMLDRRMNDKGKNWRHVFKALTVLDYCLHSGSENTVKWAKDNIYIIKTLREFNYVSEDGKDQGSNVRIKARDITELLQDDDRLRSERKNRTHMHNRLGLQHNDNMSGSSSYKKSSYKKHSQTFDASDDDKELQRAIEESKLQSEDDKLRSLLKTKQEEEELALALQLSKEEEELRNMALLQKERGALLLEQSFQQPQQPSKLMDFFIKDTSIQQPQNIDYIQNMHLQSTNAFENQQNLNTQNIGYYQPQENYQLNHSQINYPLFQQNEHANNPYSSYIDAQTFQGDSPFDHSYLNRPQDQFKSLRVGSNNPFIQMANLSDYKPNYNTISSPLEIYSDQKSESNNTIPTAQSIFFPQHKYDASYQAKLSSILQAKNPEIDTFGNTGDLRIPSQHIACEFVNSYGMRTKTEPTISGTLNNQKSNQTLFNRRPILSAPTGVGFKNISTQENCIDLSSTFSQSTIQENNPYLSSSNHSSHYQNNPPSGSLIDL